MRLGRLPGAGGRPSQSAEAGPVKTLDKPDKQLWQFRLRPLVLHSYSCGCPPQLYLVTVETAVAAPAGDLLSIGNPRGSDACHVTEVAYTPSDFIGRPQ